MPVLFLPHTGTNRSTHPGSPPAVFSCCCPSCCCLPHPTLPYLPDYSFLFSPIVPIIMLLYPILLLLGWTFLYLPPTLLPACSLLPTRNVHYSLDSSSSPSSLHCCLTAGHSQHLIGQTLSFYPTVIPNPHAHHSLPPCQASHAWNRQPVPILNFSMAPLLGGHENV